MVIKSATQPITSTAIGASAGSSMLPQTGREKQLEEMKDEYKRQLRLHEIRYCGIGLKRMREDQDLAMVMRKKMAAADQGEKRTTICPATPDTSKAYRLELEDIHGDYLIEVWNQVDCGEPLCVRSDRGKLRFRLTTDDATAHMYGLIGANRHRQVLKLVRLDPDTRDVTLELFVGQSAVEEGVDRIDEVVEFEQLPIELTLRFSGKGLRCHGTWYDKLELRGRKLHGPLGKDDYATTTGVSETAIKWKKLFREEEDQWRGWGYDLEHKRPFEL